MRDRPLRGRASRAALALALSVVLVAPAAAATLVPDVPAPPLPTPSDDPRLPLSAQAPPVPGWPAPPAVTASAFVVVDVATGQVLADRAASRRGPVASTVKMLTALTARRLLPDLDQEVVVGDEVADLEGASTGLVPGARRTVRQLLEAALVRSGNDAATALAAAAAGSVGAFADELAADADRLGLDGAVLVSPSGLQDVNRLSALDLATVALALLQDPVLAAIVDLEQVTLPVVGTEQNRNELVLRDPTVTGIKTGFTTLAGNSVVASARRGGRDVLAVVLDAADADARFSDAAALLDHADQAFAAVDGLAATRLGCAGPDPTATPVRGAVAPLDAAVAVELDAVHCTATQGLARVLLSGRPVTTVPLVVAGPGPAGADTDVAPDAATGRAVVDAVQRLLRAVPPGGPPG